MDSTAYLGSIVVPNFIHIYIYIWILQILSVVIIVLKTRLDRLVRLVQLGTRSQSSSVKTPKTSQQPKNRSEIEQKLGLNREFF